MVEPLEDAGAPGEEHVPTPTPKRKVSYNQDAVLCPVCTKRIRLNNDGRLRVHVSGKAGTARCMGSDGLPELFSQATFADVDNSANEAKTQVVVQKTWDPTSTLFSDLS